MSQKILCMYCIFKNYFIPVTVTTYKVMLLLCYLHFTAYFHVKKLLFLFYLFIYSI